MIINMDIMTVKILLLIAIAFLFSCRNGLHVVVHNKTSSPLDSLLVSTSDFKSTVIFIDLKAKSRSRKFLDMENINPTDGSYVVRLVDGSRRSDDRHGYYTNGGSLDRAMHIYIKSDTIQYKFVDWF